MGHLESRTDCEEHGAVSNDAVARSLVVASAPSSCVVVASANRGIFGKCLSAFLLFYFLHLCLRDQDGGARRQPTGFELTF